MELTNQTAFVTGAASGLGEAAAIALAGQGANVAVCGHVLEGAQSVTEKINSGGGRALALQLDVEDSGAVDEAVRRTVEEFGSIDIVVHSAGMNSRFPIIDMTDEQWLRVIDVNLNGSFYVFRAAGRYMVKQGSGTMILISSDRGIYGARGSCHYASSKAAQVALMKSAALEMGGAGVTVNAINPGTVDTKLTRMMSTEEGREARRQSDPLGRLGQPEEIADLVVFLATSGKFITGQLVTTRMRNG